MHAAHLVFSAWDDSFKEFTNVAREVTRKRSEKFIPIKVSARHVKLEERVRYFRAFRKQHHQLLVMVGPLGSETTARTRGGGAGAGAQGQDGEGVGEGEGAGEGAAEDGQEQAAAAAAREWKSTLGDIDMDAEVRLALSSSSFPVSSRSPSPRVRRQVRQAYGSVKNVDVLDVSPGASLLASLTPFLFLARPLTRPTPPQTCRGHRLLDRGRDGLQRARRARREPHHLAVARPARRRKERQRDVPRL